MTAHQLQNVQPNHRLAYDAQVLTDIFSPAVNLTIWERTLTTNLQVAVNVLLNERPNLRIQESGSVKEINHRLINLLGANNQYTPLLTDIAECMDMFQCLFDHDTLGLRMTCVEKVMCPRFHVDRVLVRGICTYAGPSTEWLPNHCLPEKVQQQRGPLPTISNIERYIQRIPTGAFALMKGISWQGNEGKGLIHRSPECAKDQRRLLMTIDLC